MSLSITKHSETFSTSTQITADEVTEIATLGFKTIINNRPDGEGGPSQPSSKEIQQTAEKLGISYLYLPVIPNNISDSEIAQCSTFLVNAPTPILGFCRTGNRARAVYEKASNISSNTAKSSPRDIKQAICNFFENKCLVTKLVRKFSNKSIEQASK